jgi:hypothetical protein
MSTEFMPSKRIAFDRIRNFSHNGVKAVVDDGNLSLREGENYLWAYPACPGRRVTFCRQSDNEVMPIIEALEDYFHVRIITEYEEEFFDIIKTERRIARRRKARKKRNADHAPKAIPQPRQDPNS